MRSRPHVRTPRARSLRSTAAGTTLARVESAAGDSSAGERERGISEIATAAAADNRPRRDADFLEVGSDCRLRVLCRICTG